MSQSSAQRSEASEPSEAPGARPVDTARVGNVEIAIWRNKGPNGDFFTASTPKIRYKDESGTFKDGSSYGAVDLLALAEAAREASGKIRDLSKAKSPAR